MFMFTDSSVKCHNKACVSETVKIFIDLTLIVFYLKMAAEIYHHYTVDIDNNSKIEFTVASCMAARRMIISALAS